MTSRRVACALLAASTVVAALPASAEPRAGQALPAFTASDLSGRRHSSQEISGRRTLVVAITDPGARGPTEAWMLRSRARHPGLRQVALVALRVPFLVPDSVIHNRARGETPRDQWGGTWLDRGGRLQRALGVRGSDQPWAFVVGPDGRVIASTHGGPDDPGAAPVWAALSGR